ncbi:hypothetical protein Clacol_000017 [Clathrus columnatus]|uniref:Uncharacterized protein n=1 Tax=Clathrus columnatus TaxID=1419009 RepID=A0AAV5A1R3_9AGAM|nr:hypothetical protein Clacol_000017 [Clathrus columnatus]
MSTFRDVETQPLAKQYLVLAQGLGPAIIGGAANFAIEHTIAGDLGVTVIIQSILSTIIASILVRGDVRAKREKPLSRPWPDVDWWREQKDLTKWIGLERDLLERKGFTNFLRTLFITALQGKIQLINIQTALYGGINMQGTWIPEVTKAIFGAVLSLFMNATALVLGAEAHKPTSSRIKNTPSRPQMKLNEPVSPIAAHLSNGVTR